jgi:hypothetical protein
MKIYYFMYQGIPFADNIPQPMFETKWDVPPIKVVAQADYDAVAAELTHHKANHRSADALEEEFERKDARIAALETELAEVRSHREARNKRIAALEAALTAFLVWNGTDYADDETREYALVGICEDAYNLVPASASEPGTQ